MKTILIVDDRVSAREVLKDFLIEYAEHNSIELNWVEKEDYSSASEYLSTTTPDIVLLDLDLGDKKHTGHHLFLEKIIPKNIPAIIITAENYAGLVEQLYTSNNIPFIEKPIDKSKLIAELKKVLDPSYQDKVSKRYKIIELISNSGKNISNEIELRDQEGRYVKLSDIIFIQSAKEIINGKEDSICHCFLKGFKGPVVCYEELGRFKKRLAGISMDFKEAGRFYVVNLSHHTKNGNRHELIMSNSHVINLTLEAWNRFISK